MNRRDLRRLERLETLSREQYDHAFRRAALRVVRHLGANEQLAAKVFPGYGIKPARFRNLLA